MDISKKNRFVINQNYQKELVLLFFFWPFLSFIIALRNFGSKHSKNIVTAFFAFFGFTMSLSREGMDGFKHAVKFKESTNMDFSDFADSLYLFFTNLAASNTLDIYTSIINFTVSRFTDSYHYVFLIHATIYAYFSVKVLGLVFDEFKGSFNRNAQIFFVLLFFLLPISNVHGIRFPIATWIFIYGAYSYIVSSNRKYLLWIFLACFVHFSFLLVFAIVLVYHYLGTRNSIYIAILVLSFILPNLFSGYLTGFSGSDIGEGLEGKITGYTREGYIAARNEAIEGRNWYVRFRIPILQYTFMGLLFIINFIRKNDYVQDNIQKRLFSFIILFLAFVNFGFAIDSLGRRFLLIWFVFVAIYMIRFFQLNPLKRLSRYTLLSLFPIALWIIVQIRIAFYITSYMWFAGNPFTALFIETEAIFN